MGKIDETYVLEKEILEEFFKNSTSFILNNYEPIPHSFRYISENVFKPEDYNIDFLKEKIESFCYYLYSNLDQKNGNWCEIIIFLRSENEIFDRFRGFERIIRLFNNASWDNDSFMVG